MGTRCIAGGDVAGLMPKKRLKRSENGSFDPKGEIVTGAHLSGDGTSAVCRPPSVSISDAHPVLAHCFGRTNALASHTPHTAVAGAVAPRGKTT
ncbi:hypothetical protein GCM10023335_85470 [Streptomyces siamensis]|uniref:Uncharacterized protein n=1 Tax=Streptomyces siamensis TaxID=1274986 RepID=A0ABP9JNJ7_9ACTN